MLKPWNRLGRPLINFDLSPFYALGWRLLVVAVFFSPWSFRFERSPFRMEEVDPAILAEAQALGVNFLDAKLWPSAMGTALRFLAVGLAFGFAWWVLSRLRRWITLRYGGGALPLVVVLIAVGVMAATQVAVKMPGLLIWDSALPVWGGWVHYPLLHTLTFNVRLIELTLAGPLTLELLLQGLETRLQLAAARDGALRARLAPHFLFNTLNTLHAQIEEDPAGAQDTTERLAQLFRQVLERSEHATVPLREELSFVEDYLGIERARLGARLKVVVVIPEEAAEARIPVLGLQTLVENAIRHGIEPRREGGELRIEAQLEGKRLRVWVDDPGDGSAGHPGAGKALDNLKARLARPKDLAMTRLAQGFRVSFSYPQV